MGKKKGKKKNVDWDDDDLPGLGAGQKKMPPPKSSKGGGGGFDDDFDDDGFDDEPVQKTTKKKLSKKERRKMAAQKKRAAEAAFDDDGFEDDEAPAKPQASTAADNAFANYKKKSAAGQAPKAQKKQQKKKGKAQSGFAALAGFDDFDDEDQDDGDEEDEPSEEEPEPAPEPAPEPEQPAEAPQKPAEEATTDSGPPKNLTKAQLKKWKKKQAYQKQKEAKQKKAQEAKERKAREAAELDAMLAAVETDKPKEKPKEAPTKPEEPASPAAAEPAADGAPEPEKKLSKAAEKKRKQREKQRKKKEEEKLKKEEAARNRKEKNEGVHFEKAVATHGKGDYENALSYLDFLDRSKPEFFAEKSLELRARITLEQENYAKAEKVTADVIFEKDFQKIDASVLEEGVNLLKAIEGAPIIAQTELEDLNDGRKSKTLLMILEFRLNQFRAQKDKAEKRRAKRAAQKGKAKSGGAPDARALAMRQAILARNKEQGKGGKRGKRGKKKGGKSFKNQAQIEQEQREEFERQAEAERKRKEEEAVRLKAEREAAEAQERERQARLKKEEEKRQKKREAKVKAQQKAQRRADGESESDDDWDNSGSDEPSPKASPAKTDGSDEGGWEDSGADSDGEDESADETPPARGGYGADTAFVDDDDFADEDSASEKKDPDDDEKDGGKRGSGSTPSKNKDGLTGQEAVLRAREEKARKLAEKGENKFRININKALKRNDKDWRKQIRKLPDRKAYKARFEKGGKTGEGGYANHTGGKKTLLRDMIADKIQEEDDNWSALMLAESVTLMELRVKATLDEFSDKRIKSNLRAPIGVIMGHVDTGKTKILDYIRKTKVQDNEVGGITQQIGATFLPIALIKKNAAMVQKHLTKELSYDLPGLLIIDTPGHESFSNLRARGSSLCDIAVLVIDIMHGLEPQTLESIKMLQKGEHPFVIALNKIDRCYGWKINTDWDFQSTIATQNKSVCEEFEKRSMQAIAQLAELEINADLWWKVAGKDYTNTTLICPTSAHTGEGLPDLLMLLVQLTQKTMDKKLQYISSLRATILEVKTTVGHGYTLDVILQNGFINRGDTIVVCGMEGPIKTQIRALLVPAEGKEMRVKGDWQHVDQIQAAAGVRISAPGLEKAIAGSELMVIPPGSPAAVVEEMKDRVQEGFTNVMGAVDTTGMGVFVVASTLGALEALIAFLTEMKVPICGISIGTVYKKQVMKAAIMLEKRKEYACILAFNVDIDVEAAENADQMGVRIFEAEIIYNLFDDFKEYLEAIQADRRADTKDDVVFPVKLQIFEDKIFRARDPLIMGVKVVSGTLRKGCPLVAMKYKQTRKGRVAEPFPIGRVVSIENEGKEVDVCDAGDEIAIKIVPDGLSPIPMYQRHFDHSHMLFSRISRRSIDILKESYREECIKHLTLLKHMKALFNVI